MNYLSYYTRYIVQALSIGILKLFVFRPSTTTLKELRLENRQCSIIAANHRHALDPFYITCSFRWRELVHLLPFAIMTANKFYDPLWLRVPAWLGGCFPAYGPAKLHGVNGAVTLLEKGYTLLMFPEGRRIATGKGVAKPGITRILQSIPDPRLILAHIEWQKPPRRARVNFTLSERIPHKPEVILEHIYEL